MQMRAKSVFGNKLTEFIGPSITDPIGEEVLELPNSISPLELCSNQIKLLFLCGWQLNKNVMLIPYIAHAAKSEGIALTIYLTASIDGSKMYKDFVKLLKSLDVDDRVFLIGSVEKEQLPSLFKQIDYVMLLSRLESFSNNIIEAWYHRRILMVSDEIWSRSICDDAAIYVERNEPVKIVKVIRSMEADLAIKARIINKGSEKLKEFPSVEQRIMHEVEFLRKVYETN